MFFALTIGKSCLKGFNRAQISNKELEKLLRFLTLTIGKSFLNDSKRAQISKKKLEKLLMFDPDHRKMILG